MANSHLVAGDLPPEAAARLAAIRRELPASWRVTRTWQDAGDWAVELSDETSQVVAQVVLGPIPQGTRNGESRGQLDRAQ